MTPLRIGTLVLQEVNTEPLDVPEGMKAWRGGGWTLTALPGPVHFEVELGWKAKVPSIFEAAEVARSFWPDNSYAMRLTHRNRMLIWGKNVEPTDVETHQESDAAPAEHLERGEADDADRPAGTEGGADPA